ncbi:hypothetical protein VitviT2T_007576 [Vitis vinifera]|uniref:Protein ENDOSPERM DEFECTIVE 1 n=2 Tax=Vitis vinifera TaxID=29760 RepID=A0ABY9BZ93_VITVI|nr:hypothetical protein VitviT2T_007576 [Vitis vinifera]
MVEVNAPVHQGGPTNSSTGAVPPPPRRPRVREVSSRFMSPVVSSSSSGDLHLLNGKSPISKPTEFHSRQQQQQRSTSAQRRRQNQELEPLSCADENRPEMARSLETPFVSQCKAPLMSSQRKQRVVKLFKENGGRGEQQLPDGLRSKVCDGGKPIGRSTNGVASLRPDTPIVSSSMDRIVSSRFRLMTPNSHRSSNASAMPAASAATKLLQSSGMSLSTQTSSVGGKVDGVSSQQDTCANPSSLVDDNDDKIDQKIAQNRANEPALSDSESCSSIIQGIKPISSSSPVQNCKTRSHNELRSSMPEADMLPTMSTRLLAERNCGRGNVNGAESSKFSASPFSRSLNLTPSSSDQSLFHSIKTSEKLASVLSKPHTNSMKNGSIYLPPLPPCTKPGTDARKGRKVSGHQEDVHSLKLLHNHYLQWRFANAKAEATMQAQRRETEKALYSLGVKISDLYELVKGKRIELGLLQRTNILVTILEAQMPFLDEWSILEGDYSVSLSEAIQALVNASLQLPINGNIRADIREVNEALYSATKMMEIIISNVQMFMPKAEEMDNLVSELARVTGGERTLSEECGYLLSRTHALQVEECSLRSQLIQQQRSSSSSCSETQEQ